MQRVAGGFKVTVGGKTLSLSLGQTDESDILVAQIGDKPVNVLLEAADENSVSLIIGGERFVFRQPQAAAGLKTPSPQPTTVEKDVLSSPLPGRVISVLVREGQQVKSGEPVVVIESMKMETAVASDREAAVAKVLVSEGSTVKRGQALVRFGT